MLNGSEVDGDRAGTGERLLPRPVGDPDRGVHDHAERRGPRAPHASASGTRPIRWPVSAAQDGAEHAAEAPGDHLPRRPRALPEDEVRRERGDRADDEAGRGAEREAGDQDDVGRRLDVRQRRERDPPERGERCERRDEREHPRGRVRALVPGEARPRARRRGRSARRSPRSRRDLDRHAAAQEVAALLGREDAGGGRVLGAGRGRSRWRSASRRRAPRRRARRRSADRRRAARRARAIAAANSASCVATSTATPLAGQLAQAADERALRGTVHPARRLVEQQRGGRRRHRRGRSRARGADARRRRGRAGGAPRATPGPTRSSASAGASSSTRSRSR